MSTPLPGPLAAEPLYATSADVLVWWDDPGQSWRRVAVSNIAIGDTAPASPVVGNAWWDSVGGQLYIWYDDGTSAQWVPASNQPGPPGTPGTSIPLPVAIASGGTGATTAAAALTNLGAVAKAGDVMTGGLTVNGAVLLADAPGAADAQVEIGQGRTGSGNAYIDMHAVAGGDFETRLIRGSGANGAFFIQNAGTGNITLTANATSFNFSPPTAAGTTFAMPGAIDAGGIHTRPGTAGASQVNQFNISWGSGPAHLWIDAVDQGSINLTCDYRIKDNIAPLSSMWVQVKALNPISYTLKGHEELRHAADATPRWGFLAHELQETLLPSAASGYKDAPNLVQSPDPLALFAALTRALQEAMTRIEALEAARDA